MQKHRVIYNFLIFIILFMPSCATIPKLNTSTGKPEIIISDVSKKEISDAIVNKMLSDDFQVIRSEYLDEYCLTFARRKANLSNSAIFESNYSKYPELRYTYTLVDVQKGIRIMTLITGVRSPGSADELYTDLSKKTQLAQYTQLFLEKLKIAFENKKDMP
jgi:hypothetical protein